MVRILTVLIVIALFLGVRDYTTLDRVTDALSSAPYGEDRRNIKPGFGWREYPCGEMDTQVDQGHACAEWMKRYRNNLVIRLFTYTEPSVDSLRESMLMGSIEANVGSEKKARALQDRFVSRMLAHGFAKSFVDRVAFTSVGKRPRERVVSLAKGDLYGHVYYTYDSAHVRWRVRAAVQHPLIRSWGDPYTSRWKSWLLFDRMTLPDSLVRELESARIAGMFPPGVWSGVKDIPRTGSDRFSIADFIAFYRKFSPAAVAPEHRPAALLLKNYLARYLFVYGIPKLPGSNRIDVKGITPHRINENDLLPLGVDFIISESGSRAQYGENHLFDLAREYPDSYWGQFAFSEAFRMDMRQPTKDIPVCGWANVETEGKNFIARHPESEFVPDVLFHLGKRAETRWNYNIARENRAYHFKNKWRDRKLSEWDDKERRKLVDIYERVLASPKREVYEDHLKHILPRLRMGVAAADYHQGR